MLHSFTLKARFLSLTFNPDATAIYYIHFFYTHLWCKTHFHGANCIAANMRQFGVNVSLQCGTNVQHIF